ncbi:YdcF family protein [Oricola sp.]|uniref:YdcF family protein n=1 Tax=Oricola sp. TaxID=1979950 RepID=UPI003BABA989
MNDSRQNPVRLMPRFVRGVRVAVQLLAVMVFAGAVAFVAGFFVFLSTVHQHADQHAETVADGIVVLTGGSRRIEAALQLLEDDKGARLLISGVHPSTSRDVLRKTFSTDDTRFRCCVDVDREALDTAGNAAETARWAARHGFDTLIVVTNDYHMPRSLLEMRLRMSEVDLIPHAVVANSPRSDDPAVFADRYRVLFGEYLKYGVARMRSLSGLADA